MVGGLAVLRDLLAPHVPLYAFAVSLITFDSVVGATTWHAIASLLDGVDAGTMGSDELRAVFATTFCKLFLCVFGHMVSRTFTARVTGRFANAARSAVLRGVLRQDIVFFDTHPSGVIQEQLNHDVNELALKCAPYLPQPP